MLALLVYGYCTGVCSSRRIARATYQDLAFRFIAGGAHPDFRTIGEFRGRFLDEIAPLFLEVLKLCQRAGLFSLGHVALDGTKVQANASKRKAMRFAGMQKSEAKLKAEIEAPMTTAEQADVSDDAELGAGEPRRDLPAGVGRPRGAAQEDTGGRPRRRSRPVKRQ